MSVVEIKKCSICKNTKDVSAFHKDKSVSGGIKAACKECTNQKRKQRYHSNDYDKLYNSLHKEKQKVYSKQYRIKNKEKVNKTISEWSKNNPEKRLATALKYKYNKAKATPKWDNDLTAFITIEAADIAKKREKLFKYKWHIDHIVPLQGKNVCGLHVWNNLRVIPAKENQSKGNKYDNPSC